MKRAIALAMLLAVGSPAFADYSQSGGTKQTKCYKTVYREEYVPGTRNNPGYVRRWTEKKKVPCKNRNRGHRGSHQHPWSHRPCSKTMVLSMTTPVSKEQSLVESPVVVLVQPSLVVMDVGGQSPWELSVDQW